MTRGTLIRHLVLPLTGTAFGFWNKSATIFREFRFR